MDQVVLEAVIRTETGKGPSRRYRKAGNIPGVIYKAGQPTHHLTVNIDQLYEVIEHGRNTMVSLKLDALKSDSDNIVMIKDLQRDPVTGRPLHVDFIGIDLDKPLDVDVPLELLGVPAGIAEGGILQQNLRRLFTRCLPTAIPKRITVDVTALDIGGSIHVKDLVLPEGVECIEDLDTSVASVVMPAIEVEETPEEEELTEEEAAAAAAAAEAEGKEGSPEKKEETGEKKEDGKK